MRGNSNRLVLEVHKGGRHDDTKNATAMDDVAGDSGDRSIGVCIAGAVF